MKIQNIIFDLGGVLIDWNPRYVYRSIFNTEEEIDWFFEHICTSDWNENQDAGYPLAQATADKIAQFPEWKDAILAYYGRWEEMLGGSIATTVEILDHLHSKNQFQFYALTYWSSETFPLALKKFDFLHWFDGRVVSGEEKTRKPFVEFYQILFDRYQIHPSHCLFIDDNYRNVLAGQNLGMQCIHFKNPALLKSELVTNGIW